MAEETSKKAAGSRRDDAIFACRCWMVFHLFDRHGPPLVYMYVYKVSPSSLGSVDDLYQLGMGSISAGSVC